MGILYIDEAGNTGLKDKEQPNLVYGGPFIEPNNWKLVIADFQKLESVYKSLIYTKFNKPQDIPQSFESMSNQINFLSNFHFHASEIIGGRHLWGKLNMEQRFQALEDMINVLKNHDVPFVVGILNKDKLLQELQSGEIDSLADFSTLLPLYFDHLEKQIGEKHYIVIIADGEAKEKAILHHILQQEAVKKCTPEQFIYSADDLPILQLADAGLWIIQAYKRLKPSDKSYKAERTRSLYKHLEPILKLYEY